MKNKKKQVEALVVFFGNFELKNIIYLFWLFPFSQLNPIH